MYGVQYGAEEPAPAWDDNPQYNNTNASSLSIPFDMPELAASTTLDSILERKRLRTKTACDYCRKRKSKCNGENPCSCCITHNRDCIYTIVPRERKKRITKASTALTTEKVVDPGSLQRLTSRLSALENVLSKITGKLDDTTITDEDTALINSTRNYSIQSAPAPPNDDEAVLRSFSFPSIASGIKKYIKSTSTLKEMLATESQEWKNCKMRAYFGAHSIFNAFSSKSLSWFKSKLLSDDSIMTPIKNLPCALTNAFEHTSRMWLNQKDENMENRLKTFFTPDMKHLVYEILDNYYHNIHLISFISDIDSIRDIFQAYFYGDAVIQPTASDYLVMNAIIALCICNYDSTEVFDPNRFPSLSTTSPERLRELRESCYENATYAYFKVSMKLDGLRTIQGIGLLLLYFDVNHVTDIHLNFTLTSVMIRYAQELGLDRIDSIELVHSEEEREERRRLLWFCMHMDVETCYRNGKSLLFNPSDLSTLTELDDHFLSVPVDPFLSNLYERNCQNLICNSQMYGSQYYYAYYTLMLTRVKAKSYGKLYGRAAYLLANQLLGNLEGINSEMFALADLMEPEVRPMLHYVAKVSRPKSRNAQFNTLFLLDQKFKYESLMLQISFFSHMALINRMPFMRDVDDNDERYVKFGNLSLDSSRTVLYLVSEIDSSNTPNTILSWLSFYPFIAYCSLLSNSVAFSKGAELHEDCLLLIATSMNFLANKESEQSIRNWNVSRVYDSKLTIFDLIARVMLRVLVNYTDKESDHDYCSEIPGLTEHLNACHIIFPDLFKGPAEREKPLNLMFMNSLTSAAGRVPYASDPSSVSSFDTDEKMEHIPDFQIKDFNFEDFNEEAFNSLLNSQMYNLPNQEVGDGVELFF